MRTSFLEISNWPNGNPSARQVWDVSQKWPAVRQSMSAPAQHPPVVTRSCNLTLCQQKSCRISWFLPRCVFLSLGHPKMAQRHTHQEDSISNGNSNKKYYNVGKTRLGLKCLNHHIYRSNRHWWYKPFPNQSPVVFQPQWWKKKSLAAGQQQFLAFEGEVLGVEWVTFVWGLKNFWPTWIKSSIN